MDQIFRINVGPETIQGRLPAVRVGKGFCSLFHITGVAYDDTVPVPKIWIGESENTALFWEAVWDSSLGLWVVEVGGQAAAKKFTSAGQK